MKKRIALVIALVVVLAIALPVIAACDKGRTVESIEFVNPTRNYNVGDVIDYDNLQVKVTYSDGTSETKKVSELVVDGAQLSTADLSKEGNPSYSLTYKGETAQVVLTVTSGTVVLPTALVDNISLPEFYVNYVQRSTTGDPNDDATFKIKGETYEVGNVNKFLFKPIVTVLDLENEEPVEDPNPKTVVKVYSKDTKEGTYTQLQGSELEAFVTVENNAYQFSDEAAGKYVKLEISLDEDSYDLSGLEEANKILTVELFVVDNGYNVYDQIGLSVMADLEKYAWSKEIWKCEYHEDTAHHKTTVTPIEGESTKLLADDKYLCQYVDTIDWVVLHGSIELDPDQMPSLYFWSESGETSVGLDTIKANLAGTADAATWQNSVVGTLRDGNGSGTTGTHGDGAGDINYSRVMDVNRYESSFAGGVTIQGNDGIETNIGLNMTKAIFATKRVSVSGNYNSITYTNRDQTKRSQGGRVLLSYADYTTGMPNDPIAHWNVFQFIQPTYDGADLVEEFTLKNLAVTGNNPIENSNAGTTEPTTTFKPAGLMLSSSYAAQVTYRNFNASKFYSSILQDNYGDFKVKEGKFSTATDAEAVQAKVLVDNAKITNNYSNMTYMWRGNIEVKNSVMKNAGGPLFILDDSNSGRFMDYTNSTTVQSLAAPNANDGGPKMTVDTDSELESYATGNESWYAMYSAQVLFQNLSGEMATSFQTLGKSYLFERESNQYFNIIAAIIPTANGIFDGKDADDNNPNQTNILNTRGTFTQVNGEGETVQQFLMNDSVLAGVIGAAPSVYSLAGFDSATAAYLPILTCGNATPILWANTYFVTSLPTITQPVTAESDAGQSWQNANSDLLFVRMSASAGKGGFLPYFGIVLGVQSVGTAA